MKDLYRDGNVPFELKNKHRMLSNQYSDAIRRGQIEEAKCWERELNRNLREINYYRSDAWTYN